MVQEIKYVIWIRRRTCGGGASWKYWIDKGKYEYHSIPIHQDGKLLLRTAENELTLSVIDPDRSDMNAPRYIPIILTITVELLNSRIVFGNLSIIMSLTLEEPESVVKKLDLPNSRVTILDKVLKKRLGEYHGSSNPKDLTFWAIWVST